MNSINVIISIDTTAYELQFTGSRIDDELINKVDNDGFDIRLNNCLYIGLEIHGGMIVFHPIINI